MLGVKCFTTAAAIGPQTTSTLNFVTFYVSRNKKCQNALVTVFVSLSALNWYSIGNNSKQLE